MEADRISRINELVRELNAASEAYYSGDVQIMSDFEYDRLYDELADLESSTGYVHVDSPTLKVGYEVIDSLEKVKHETKLLSLDKTKDVAKLESFLGEMRGLLSWKLDGLTIVLKYADGRLIQAVTRGNGEIGEDVTHNAKMFRNVPKSIEYDGELVIRGEAIIYYSDFKRINAGLDADEIYKNPRNLCSGTVRQLNNEKVSKRNVRFFAFTVIKALGIEFDDSKNKQLLWLKSLGFAITENKTVDAADIAEAVAEFKSRAKHNDFASDGLVLTYDSLSYSESLGATAKFPRDSIAFKWADEIEKTKLIDVVWNTSRTGLINPVAVFEPVELEGTTVNKASLHNLSIFEELQLGAGDIITVYKANMIIPQIADNLSRSGGLEKPELCKVCSFKTEIVAQKEGKALYCLNPNCRAQLISALSHFTSRDCMNIEGLSEETLEKFVELGFIDNYTDIFELERYDKEIKQIKGFGEKSYQKIIDSIEKSKDVPLPNLINALGIKQVGLSNAKILCAMHNNSIESIINATYEQLIGVKHFGDAIASSLTLYFSDKRNLDLLEKILSKIRITEQTESAEDKTLDGLNFVITGELERFANRKELQELIERKGGKVVSSVSKKTSYLINNDINSGSSKNESAKRLGVPIINESELLKLTEEKG